MRKLCTAIVMVVSLLTMSAATRAQSPPGPAVPVTIDTYNRAQSDVYFAVTLLTE